MMRAPPPQSGVHVEVGPDLPRDLRKLLEIVDVAGLGGARDAHNGHELGGLPLCPVFPADFFHRLAELLDVDLVRARVNRGVHHAVLTDAEDGARLADGVVAAFRYEHHGLAVAVVLQGADEPFEADALEFPAVGGKCLGHGQGQGSEVRQRTVRGDVAQGDVGVLDVGIVEPVRVLVDEPVHPAQEFPLQEGRRLCALDLHLVLVQTHRDHLQEDHVIGNGTRHVANVEGVCDLDGVLDHVVLDLGKHVPDELGLVGHPRAVEDPRKAFHGDGGVDPSLFLEKIMDHVQEVDAELHEPVRGVGHDEKLFHVRGGALYLSFARIDAKLQRLHG